MPEMRKGNSMGSGIQYTGNPDTPEGAAGAGKEEKGNGSAKRAGASSEESRTGT